MLVGLLLVCFKSGNVTSSLSPLAIDPDLRQLVYPWKKTKGTKGYDQSKKLCRTIMFLAQWNAWIRNWYGRRNGGSLFIPSLLFLSLCASPNGGYLCVNVNSNLLSTKEKEREKVAQLVQRVWTHFVADVWPLCSTCWGLAAGALHCIVLHTISVFFRSHWMPMLASSWGSAVAVARFCHPSPSLGFESSGRAVTLRQITIVEEEITVTLSRRRAAYRTFSWQLRQIRRWPAAISGKGAGDQSSRIPQERRGSKPGATCK